MSVTVIRTEIVPQKGLFVPFFKRCNDVLHLLEANMGVHQMHQVFKGSLTFPDAVSHHLDTTLAHRVVQAGKVTVLIYGETGILRVSVAMIQSEGQGCSIWCKFKRMKCCMAFS